MAFSPDKEVTVAEMTHIRLFSNFKKSVSTQQLHPKAMFDSYNIFLFTILDLEWLKMKFLSFGIISCVGTEKLAPAIQILARNF